VFRVLHIKKLTVLVFAFMLVLGIVFVSQNFVLAEETELLHLVVLADISGSLNTDDTENLQRLIQRIPRFLDNEKLKQSKLTIIAFASEAVQICDTSSILDLENNIESYNNCLEQIQASKRNNPNIEKRASGIGIDTNQIKAFEKGSEVISIDPENYIPVFLLLTDGALDPVGTGPNSNDSINEFDRGFFDVRPEMQEQNVQLFVFGFGDAKLEDLTKWSEFSAQRRACQEVAPERIYPSEGDIFSLLIRINTAMNQVTCGEATALITLEPGEPKEYYISDLVEKLNIKVDLKGTTGIDAEVKNPLGNIIGQEFEINTSGECSDIYIVCYEILNPDPGVWTLSSSVFSSEAQSASIIVADITLYGTFTIISECEVNTLRDGFENCNFDLVPSRPGAKDLNEAIDSASFDFVFNNVNFQERGTFFKDSLSLQLFRSITVGKANNLSIQINPIYSDFQFSDNYKWLQFVSTPSPSYTLEPLNTSTTTIQEETEILEEETSFPWLLIGLILLVASILAYLSMQKRDLPPGSLNYGLVNSSNLSNIVIYGSTVKEFFDVAKQETGIEISEGDKDSVNLLILESIERKGFRFWDSRPAKQFQLKFEDLLEKSVDGVEIIIYDDYVVSFIPDETFDDYENFNEDDGDDFKF
jgi:uncharacterized protein YegL